MLKTFWSIRDSDGLRTQETEDEVKVPQYNFGDRRQGLRHFRPGSLQIDAD